MTVSSSAAERIVDDILSSNHEIPSAGVIDRSGNIIANNLQNLLESDFKEYTILSIIDIVEL
jgi:hypothetical protein